MGEKLGNGFATRNDLKPFSDACSRDTVFFSPSKQEAVAVAYDICGGLLDAFFFVFACQLRSTKKKLARAELATTKLYFSGFDFLNKTPHRCLSSCGTFQKGLCSANNVYSTRFTKRKEPISD
jgi:hypothetical protein